jgi:hypothetical protein
MKAMAWAKTDPNDAANAKHTSSEMVLDLVGLLADARTDDPVMRMRMANAKQKLKAAVFKESNAKRF